MLRPRSALPVVVAALVVWVATVHVGGGLDAAATEYRLGTQLMELGLPGFGSLLLGRASRIYRARLTSAPSRPQASSEASARFVQCEFVLARLFWERGNAAKAKYHYGLVKSTCPEAALPARAWSAYVQAHDGQAGSKRDLLALLVDAPKDPLPAYLAGRLFLEQGKLDEARRYLKRSLSLPQGETYDTALALAHASQQAQQVDEAVKYARQALQLGVTEAQKRAAARTLKSLGVEGPAPTLLWARTFALRHRWGLTGVAALVVVLLWPTWLGLLARVVPAAAAPLFLLARSGDPAAIRSYEAALRRRPDNARYTRALAEAYRRVGAGASRAADLWERLYVLRPGDTEARDQTVRLALQSGRESEAAVAACQDWFDDHSDHPDAGTVAAHLARVYRTRQAMPSENALAVLEAASAAAPADRDLQLYLGTLYSHHGRHARAATLLGELLAADPSDDATRLEYAHALIGAGEAYTAYRHLRVLDPGADVTTDLYLAGVVAHQAGRYRESLRILQEVVRRDPGLFDVEDRVAEASVRVAHERLGRFGLAETVAVHESHLLHRATHPEHGEVLLLVFRRDFSDALEFPSVFAAYFGELREPIEGCAQILDLGSDEEEYFVAYRMPGGRPLARLLEARGPMPALEAAEAMVPVLMALERLHGTGRLHADLRLSAVWLDESQRATLVGAGASLVAETGPAAGPPGARSPFHAAPEVVQRQEFSVASDVYAAGCMLYELLVGGPPLEGPTLLATMMAHVTIEPEPPSMRVPNIPPEMDELVLRALAKDPAARPPSAAEFARGLREWAYVPEELEVALPEPEAAQPDVPSVEGPVISEPATGPPDPSRWWTFYEGLALVAAARFARVYRGVHRQTRESHAIKHLQVPRTVSAVEGPKGTRAAQAVWRLFANEMHLLQSLSEAAPPVPGITVMLQAYRADEGSPAYAMPLMKETLAARIEREGPLPEAEAVEAFVSLARTVAMLHERGIVHRGLSARSVMLDRAGSLCLGGFDDVCRLEERSQLLLAEHELQQATRSALYVLGDVRFLSPERCRGEDFDERADVYSLGALLFYLLAGVAPFEGADEMQVMLDHVSAPPPRLREVGAEASARVQEVIDRALAKSPGARFASVAAMIEALVGLSPRARSDSESTP